MNMTHNENIKAFDDIMRHLELEDERLETAKSLVMLMLLKITRVKPWVPSVIGVTSLLRKARRLHQMLKKARLIDISEASVVV